MNKTRTYKIWSWLVENILRVVRSEICKDLSRSETKEVIKDGFGALAIVAMLYVALCIPTF
ncbi:MAG: hypothetical protein RMX50_07425 [Planktomarina sp.]|nr:hypothetical protein [Planktomarina sp.]